MGEPISWLLGLGRVRLFRGEFLFHANLFVESNISKWINREHSSLNDVVDNKILIKFAFPVRRNI